MRRFFIVIVCIWCVGCINPKSPGKDERPHAIEMPLPRKLVSETNAIQLDISHMRQIGSLSTDDRDEILKQVARVDGINPGIAEIKALGDDMYTAAVRVTADLHDIVYLVRLKSGDWVISQLIYINY